MNSMIVAVILEVLAIPLMGALSDRIGRKPVYLIGTLLIMLSIVPFFSRWRTTATGSRNWR